MRWKCSVCDREFESIPDNAVVISRGTLSRVVVYKFVDGVVHTLRKVKQKTPEVRVQPQPTKQEPPKQEPPVQVEFLQTVVAVLESLPAPQPEVIAEPEIEDESDSESVTTMGAAFKRISR
jgi:hypothetical protein